MGTFTNSDFATLLDEIIAARSEEDAAPARPSMPFGFVATDDAVETLWNSVPRDFVAGLYDAEASGKDFVADPPGIQTPDEPEPLLPSIEPAEIAAELEAAHASEPRDLDRLRREFALRNHPDRVEPRLRERALVRMQIANMLIDKAKRAAAGRR